MDSGRWTDKKYCSKYRQLIAWQKGRGLVEAVYIATDLFPRDELFGLTSQIRRAAVAVPSNIAEGQGRESTKEFIRFLSIAYGSLMEVETQILIADMRKYLSSEVCLDLLDRSAEVGRLINGLSRSLVSKLLSETDH